MLRKFACVVVGTAYVSSSLYARPIPVKDVVVVKAKSQRQAIAKAEAQFTFSHPDAESIDVLKAKRLPSA